MKTVCVLIVSCPSIDHLTPRLPHLPATPVIIMDNQKCFSNKYLRSNPHPTELNFRPVGQMSQGETRVFSVSAVSLAQDILIQVFTFSTTKLEVD